MMVASSAAKVRMMFITSLVSRSLRLGREAVMFTSTPRAPARLTPSSSGQAIACSAAMRARSMPLAEAEPIIAMPCSDITVFTSWKSTFTRPGRLMISAIPATALFSTSSAARNASSCVTSSHHLLELVVEDHDQRVGMGRELLQPLLGDLHALRAFEGARLGDHRHGEDAQTARHFGDHRRRAGAGAATHARGDEHHVRAGHRLLDALAVGDRHCARLLGLGARAQPARAELDLVARLVARENLGIGVDGDELHALDALLDR